MYTDTRAYYIHVHCTHVHKYTRVYCTHVHKYTRVYCTHATHIHAYVNVTKLLFSIIRYNQNNIKNKNSCIASQGLPFVIIFY